MITQLDGMRGLAALWVSCFHSWQWLKPLFDVNGEMFSPLTYGLKPVAIFGIISGLLVYRSIRHYQRSEDLAKYFKRRFLRIYPTFFAVILTLMLIGSLPWSLPSIISSFGMLQIFFFQPNTQPAFWSLYVEEVFYIGLPVFIAVSRGRALPAACAGFVAITLLGNTCGVSWGSGATSMLAFFFTGIILCELLDKPWWATPDWRAGLVLLGLGLAVLLPDLWGHDYPGRLLAHLLGRARIHINVSAPNGPGLALGFALVFLGTIKWPGAAKVLSLAPLRFLGTISYSIFAWHTLILVTGSGLRIDGGDIQGQSKLGEEPAPFWVLPLVVAPAFMFFGAIAYRVIEHPFIVYARSKPMNESAPAPAETAPVATTSDMRVAA